MRWRRSETTGQLQPARHPARTPDGKLRRNGVQSHMVRSILPFDVVEDVEDGSDVLNTTTPVPATQAALILFGGIEVFIPTPVQLGGFARLSELIGQNVAITGQSRTITLRSGESTAWEFVQADGQVAEFISSSPQLSTLEVHIKRMKKPALVKIEQGNSWTDEGGNIRPSYRFVPGTPETT